MTRKCIVWSIALTAEATEILPYNIKRIKATLYGDNFNSNSYIGVGTSRTMAESSMTIELLNTTFEWEGINPLYACVPKYTTPPQYFIITELIED